MKELKPSTTFSGIDSTTKEGKNLLAVAAVGFIAAFDFSASLMSIQPLYGILQGDPQFYGLTLGIYDLGLVACAPFVAIYLERTHNFFAVFFGSMVCAICGNVLYGIILYLYYNTGLTSNAWVLLLFARLIMGFGGINLIAGPTYITYNSRFNERLGVLGSYQNLQSVSRVAGPVVGFLFVWMPEVSKTSSIGLQLFNFYTMAAWLSVLCALAALLIVCVYFRDENAPNYLREEHLKKFDWKNCDKHVHSIFFNTMINSLLLLLFGFVQFALLSNMFAFGTSTFRVVHEQQQLWIPYLPQGVGVASAVTVWRIVAKRWKYAFQEKIWSLIGTISAMLGPLFFVAYSDGAQGTQPLALLCLGAFFLGVATVLQLGNLEVIFSKQITQHYREVGASISTFFSIYTVSQSLSRFLGPFVTGFILTIGDFSQNNAAPCLNANGDLNVSSTCCFTGASFEISTCQLSAVNVYIPILCAITFVTFCVAIYYVFFLVDYPEDLIRGDVMHNHELDGTTTSKRVEVEEGEEQDEWDNGENARETDKLLGN